jgi:mRNA interferase HicA
MQKAFDLHERTIPVKRHRVLDRITANQLCKQAGVEPTF